MSHEKELFNLEHPHGHGAVQFAWQKGSGNYLATTGQDCSLSIYNRLGNIVQKLQLPGVCLSLSWDSDGDLLGVICNGNSSLILWDANTTKRNVIETRFRDALTCLIWAKNGPTVAVATARGNVVIYHHSTTKRIPILGKHTKAITSGDWSNEGLLALGSEDRTLSISSADGDSLRVIQLRSEPAIIQFSEMKTDERASGENTVSVIVGKKTLFLYNLQDPENPIELAFQPRYGNIVTYKWFGDGYILVGFSLGYMIAISTHIREVGQELFQVKNHRDVFSDIAVSQLLGKIASCGDNLVKIHEMSQLGESPVVMSVDDEAGVDRVAYSEDGQLLGVSTGSGHIRVFLTRLPMLAVAHGNTIALLTALTQLTLHQLTHIRSAISSTHKSNSFLHKIIYMSKFTVQLVKGFRGHFVKMKTYPNILILGYLRISEPLDAHFGVATGPRNGRFKMADPALIKTVIEWLPSIIESSSKRESNHNELFYQVLLSHIST